MSNSTALVVHQDAPLQSVIETMKHRVATKTRKTYQRENVRFIIYLYDFDADSYYIRDEVLDDLHKANDEDKTNDKTKKSQKNLRNAILTKLTLMNPTHIDRFGPVVLQKIDFYLFTKYIVDDRKGGVNGAEALSAASYGLCKSALNHLFKSHSRQASRRLQRV